MKANKTFSAQLLDFITVFADTYKISDLQAGTIHDFIIDRADEIDAAEDGDAIDEIFSDWNACQEVIYYQVAWNHIKDFIDRRHDYDFSEVRDALAEFGYESIDGLGSELIATVLTQFENGEAWAEFAALVDFDDIFTADDDDDNE